jgi:tetratricopeptide (TPR) repeat protein
MDGIRTIIALCMLLAWTVTAIAQARRDIPLEPPPPLLSPMKAAESVQKHYEALRLFVRAEQLQRQNRYVDAIRSYEEAFKLDPQSAICKALIPLCFTLDRDTQALEYCRKAIELDPSDYEMLFALARELQERHQYEAAADALAKAVQVPAVKEHPAQLAQMLFALAALREDLKQFDKAADAFEQVVKILETPEGLMQSAHVLPRQRVVEETARTYERLGKAQVLAGRHDRAVEAFKKAQANDPQRAGRLYFNLTEVYLAQQQLEPALASLQRYIATQPSGTDAYETLIRILTRLQRQHEIVPSLEQAAARDQFNQPLKLLLAEQYQRSHEPKKAEAIYAAAMADYPSEEAYRGLAKLYQDQGRWEELAKKLNHDLSDPRHLPSARPQLQVLSGDPGLVKDVATAARGLSVAGTKLSYNTCRTLGTLCRQSRNHELAEHFLRKALPDDPNPGDVYLELCRTLAEAGRFEEEAVVCREALTKKLKVSSFPFHLEMARALALAGKEKEAIAAAQQAVQQTAAGSDEYFQARYTLAIVYYRLNHLDRAEEECQELLDLRKASAGLRQVHYLLSGVYSARKDNEKAEAHLTKLLDLDPNDATACNDLGYLWAEQGKNLDEAEKLIRKALDIDRTRRSKRQPGLEIASADGDNAAYLDSLAWVLYKRGQLREACELLERAARLPWGEDPVIWDHLGEVYLKMNRRDQAAEAWREAIRLYDKSRRSGHLADRGRELKDKMKELGLSTATRRE